MLHLSLLSDSVAGTEVVARHFPFRIGRSEESDLRLTEPGVWEAHASLRLCDGHITLSDFGQAAVRLNGRTVDSDAVVRPGDLIELGSAKLKVGLSVAVQSAGRFQWILLATLLLGVSAVQTVLFWWLANQ